MFDEVGFGEHIATKFAVRVAILYGSAARGEVRPDSDIDVVCFTDGTERYPESYRWQWLLFDLPETWCDLSQRHYLGIDDALKRMQLEAEPVYRAFSRALAPDSTTRDLERAVIAIVGARP